MILVVNGYKIPTGRTGLAVRWVVDRLVSVPGDRQSLVIKGAVSAADLSNDTGTWLTSKTQSVSPLNKLWRQEKCENRRFGLWLLPGAEVLAGTFTAAKSEYQQTLIEHLASHKLSIGDMVKLLKMLPTGRLLEEIGMIVSVKDKKIVYVLVGTQRLPYRINTLQRV